MDELSSDPEPEESPVMVAAATITGDSSGSGSEDSSSITGTLSAADSADGFTDSTYFSIASGNGPINGSAFIGSVTGV